MQSAPERCYDLMNQIDHLAETCGCTGDLEQIEEYLYEYENSLMFDAYPDRIAVEQVVKEIIAVVQENEPTLLVMPESENGQNEDQTWSSCVEEIIQMMLLGEMHHRRWRYQQMNRRNY